MADRQGLLQGRSLSPVQSYANQILLALDNRRKIEEYVNNFKWSVIAADPSQGDKLFPDLFPEDIVEIRDDVDLMAIDGEVEYVSEDEEIQMTPDMMQDLLNQFGQG